jgi:triacylglycerol lipase
MQRMRLGIAALGLAGATLTGALGCVDDVHVLDPHGPGFVEPETAVSGTVHFNELLGPPYPIILVHGFSGFTALGPLDYFFRVADDYRAAGVDVTAPSLPPYNSSEDRATTLAHVIDDVLARTHKAKVHLISHSQGGMDSRVVLSMPGYANKVASLTTISTPHQGTKVADVAAAAPAGVLNPAGQVLAWLVGATNGEPSDSDVTGKEDPSLDAAIHTLTTDGARAFNEAHPDPAGVPIFSVAGVSNLRSLHTGACDDSAWGEPNRVDAINAFLVATGLILSGTDIFDPTPNDGLVSVDSARRGTFLGCIPADHLDEIGQIAEIAPGLISGFDHRDFYLRLLDHVRSVEQQNP